MTMNLNVMGQDGVVPIYDPNDRWRIWNTNELFTGMQGHNRYVPKVKDYAIDPDTYTTYIVDAIDPVTLLTTLREIRPNGSSYSPDEIDILFGLGVGNRADTYRVYIDKSVTPYVCTVDIRFKIPGSMSSYAKIFKGAMVSNVGRVISKVYDNSGNYISENVPLELLAIDSHVNYSIKALQQCYITEDLQDGEIVTIVAYSDNGHVIRKQQLMVENTSFIRSINASMKYITGISINSPFLSPSGNSIEFPINIPITSLNITGVVSYSDGSTLELPVDGTKFTMLGLDQYVSSIMGTPPIKLVLVYALANNETSYIGVSGESKEITAQYSLITTNPNNSYSVKVFGYPKWISSDVGYVMQFYMYSLDRNVYYDVTPYVRFAENTGPFDGKAYGTLQRKSITLNLKDVTNTYKPFQHTQVIEILLYDTPNTNSTVWTMRNDAVGDKLTYGNNLHGVRVVGGIRIDNGIVSKSDWLLKMYYNTYPLSDSRLEANIPVPTHFVVMVGDTEVEKTIDEWNTVIPATITQFSTIFIRFIKKTSNSILQLSIAGLIIK